MDDLDLKKIWEENGDPGIKLETKKIGKSFYGKSTGIIDRIKLIARLEDWGNFILTILIILTLIFLEKYVEAVFFGSVLLAISLYFHRLYKIIHRISYTENVLEFLEDTYSALKSFLRKYTISLAVLTPLSYFLSFSFMISQSDQKLDMTGWVILVGISLAGFAITMLFVYALYYLLYGKKARQLKKLIDSLKEEDQNI